MVVLVVEVLDTLKVERLDDSLEAKVKLGATPCCHHGRPVVAVNLTQEWSLVNLIRIELGIIPRQPV